MNPIEVLAHPYAVVLARWLLAAIFLIAGISKLFDHKGAIEAIESYQILPQPLARWFAPSLSYSEIAVGFALLLGLWTRIAAVLAMVLLLGFIIAVAVNLMRGRNLDCHCFGKLNQEKIGPTVLFRNSLLILLAAQVFCAMDG